MKNAAVRMSFPFAPGRADLEARAELLADRLSDGLKPLAPVAYNYAWSWMRDGPAVFRDINPHRWELSGRNPVRFLGDLWPSTQESVERDPELLERIEALAEEVATYLARPDRPRAGVDGPVAFFCAEFAVHVSLPIYAGGLGVLAGDILKEASDQALSMVGVGLFYRRGYFRQRIDLAGYQQEHWLAGDPKSLPMARVTTDDGSPLLLEVPIFGGEVVFQVWRVEVGRVPLLLLDSELPQNDPVERWTTARLYDGNRSVRLGQYGLLGRGGIRLLQALDLDPAVIHLNEGHSALAPLELAAADVEAGSDLAAALERARRRVVFTTHTPVPAGNETYSPAEFLGAFGELGERLGLSDEDFLGLARVTPADTDEPPGMTVLALRMSGRRNGVSRLHGAVAREMWRDVFGPAADAGAVPIDHVTNGVHVPTFVGETMDALLARHLGEGWRQRAGHRETWERVRDVRDSELWAARCEARGRLVSYVRDTSEHDLLVRGEQIEAVRAIADRLDPDALTLGFARRLATYKRLDLLAHDPERLARLLAGERPVQLILAGKAHPSDEEAKRLLVRFLGVVRESADLAQRVVFVEDYDLDVARQLVAGCDVWVNLPRRPLEASGTSGMKATFNGALQLSVLDGWWAEAYDGTNGWAIPGDEGDAAAADATDASRLYDLLEEGVVPLFYERDEEGVPREWCAMVKRALVTCGPAFSAARMVSEYVERLYPTPADAR